MRMVRQLGREDWIAAGVAALALGGERAFRVERVARGLGVSKGSFYWHFKDRADWRDAVLAWWEHRAFAALVPRGGGRAGRISGAATGTALARVAPLPRGQGDGEATVARRGAVVQEAAPRDALAGTGAVGLVAAGPGVVGQGEAGKGAAGQGAVGKGQLTEGKSAAAQGDGGGGELRALEAALVLWAREDVAVALAVARVRRERGLAAGGSARDGRDVRQVVKGGFVAVAA